MTGSTAQLANGIALLTTFGGSRLIWGVYQSVKMYQDLWRTSEIPDGLPVPPWLALTYVLANTTLTGLNCYWFGLMIKSVMGRFDKNGKGKAKEIDKDQ